jgi:hypothetical protein
MAFVSVPKDLSKVKTKIAFNLTKRQLLCFAAAAATGLPVYFLSRGIVGNTAAVLFMMVIMLPMFLFAIYEKDGQPAEKVLRNYVRTKLYWPGIRPYKTENFYEVLEKEASEFATQNKTAAKAPVGKRPSGKG